MVLPRVREVYDPIVDEVVEWLVNVVKWRRQLREEGSGDGNGLVQCGDVWRQIFVNDVETVEGLGQVGDVIQVACSNVPWNGEAIAMWTHHEGEDTTIVMTSGQK